MSKSRHILIVEDSPTNLLLINSTLSEAGYSTESASDGAIALHKIKETPPDLIILDIELPKMNGYEVCQQIKADDGLKDIPVLFISGHDAVDEKVKAFEVGGVDYITKPFQKQEIIARVKTHLELKRLREKDRAHIAQLVQEVDEHKRTETSLIESETLYQHIVQAAQEGIWLIDENNITTFVNPKMAEMLGYTVDEMLGKTLFDFMDEQGIAITNRNIERRKQGIAEQHDFELLKKNGARIYVAMETTPITDDDGNYKGALAGVIDLTERRLSEERLEKWGHVFEHAHWGVAVSSEANLDMINPEFAAMSGHTVEELQGQPIASMFIYEDAQKIPSYIKNTLETGHTVFEVMRKHKNGSVFPVRVNVTAIKDDDGNTLYRVAHMQDITESKTIESELRLSDEILQQLPNAIIVADLKGNIQRWTGNAERIFGYNAEEAMGKPASFVRHPDDESPDLDELIDQLLERKTYLAERMCMKKDGSPVLIELAIQAAFNEEGKPFAFISVSKDITEQKATETALQQNTNLLRANEERLRQAMNVARLGIWEWDIKTNITTWSGDMFRIYGITEEEFTGNGTDYIEFTHPEDRVTQQANIQKDFEQAQQWAAQGLDPLEMAKPNPKQLRIIRPDGSICTVLGDAVVALDEEGELSRMVGVLFDITDLKKAENEIRKLNEELSQQVTQQSRQLQREQEQTEIILKNVTDAIFLTDSDGKIIYVNPAWEALTGYTQLDIESETIKLLQFAEITSEERREIWDTLHSGEFWTDTVKSRRKDGLPYDNEVTIVPVKGNDGEIHNFVGVQHNVTEARELAAMKERFIADAAHDLGSPITSLAMRLEMLKRKPDELDRHVQLLEQQITHLHNLVKDLLTLSRLDRETNDVELDLFNLDHLIEQVVQTQELVAISKNIKLSFIPASNTRKLFMDTKQIERAIMNLVTNAINYTSGGGSITLFTEYTDEWGVFTIKDTGIGIAPEELPHIFKRFYRSSSARGTTAGTGLGLPIVQEIINAHKGRIDVVSTIGEGTEFKIHLPLRE